MIKLQNTYALPARPIIYAITDHHQVADRHYFDHIRRLLAAGVDVLQIREKDLTARRLYRIAGRVVRLAENFPTRVYINERFDIAVDCGAHGVHLPARSLPAGLVRHAMARPLAIGVSTHSLREIRHAARQGANYVLFGPIFDTASKRAYGLPLGLDSLRKACAEAVVPIIALGGIAMDNVPDLLQTGAYGIAGISLFIHSKNLPRDVQQIKAWGRK